MASIVNSRLAVCGNALDLKSWMLANANLKGSPTDWNTKFTLTLWYLRKWCCTLCMGSMSSIPRDKTYFLLQKFEEVMSSLAQLGNGTARTQGPQLSIMVSWSAPPPGWVLVNTDGASKGNPGPAGGSGVIRGERGEWIVGFMEKMGVCTSTKAELKAVYRELRLAKCLGFVGSSYNWIP